MFRTYIEDKRFAEVDFIESDQHELEQAIAKSGMSAEEVTKKIEERASLLISEFNGSSDITTERIADVCWAINRVFELNKKNSIEK